MGLPYPYRCGWVTGDVPGGLGERRGRRAITSCVVTNPHRIVTSLDRLSAEG
jgi:hypothetical protein